ncbi:MAG: DNA recombination protein RmuC [Bdellovibrionales bacterium]|nr:DNA recombination protein RmuC [Bdellovibrionales bacterium]
MESIVILFAALGWLLFLSLLVVWFRHYRSLIQVREQLKSKEVEAEFQKAALVQLKDEMKGTFESLAQQTLKGSNEQFLKMAELRLNQQSESALHNFDKRKMEINNIVEPLKDTLGQFYKEVQSMEKERQRSYALVETEIKKVVENSAELSKETRALKDALKKPHVRGRWGEVQLKNCVELAGMSEYADVSFQDSTDIDGKRLIPDMIVNMPGGRKVIVDAKTPIDAFLSSLEADTEELRNAEMLRHGKQVKEHVKKLSLKAYGEVFEDSADFTVMFLPNESFLYAALETQPDLVEYAMEKKILLATPPTLVGLLKVIRYGWNEDKLAKNAEEISKIGTELHKRLSDFVETFVDIGKSIDSAQKKYQQGLNRLNSRVLVQAKKMESLGAKSHKELPLDH